MRRQNDITAAFYLPHSSVLSDDLIELVHAFINKMNFSNVALDEILLIVCFSLP